VHCRNPCIKGLNPPLISSLEVAIFERERVPLATIASGKANAEASFRRGSYGTKIAGWCTADPSFSLRQSESKLQKLQ